MPASKRKKIDATFIAKKKREIKDKMNRKENFEKANEIEINMVEKEKDFRKLWLKYWKYIVYYNHLFMGYIYFTISNKSEI